MNLFLYWGGRKLSYLRYLTLITFKRCNPSYRIVLIQPYQVSKSESWASGEHGGLYDGPDYLEAAQDAADELITFNMREIGFGNHSTSEVHKSDILRNYFLFTRGGLWSDFDIVFFKPVPKDLENIDFLCKTAKGFFSIGFIGGKRDSPFFKSFFEAQKNVTKKDDSYQKYGTFLLNNKLYPQGVTRISMDLVYCINSTYVSRLFDGTVEPFTNITIGAHWYGGNPLTREWENKITPENYGTFDNILCKTIKGVLG
jgi:hypothetical protein